MAFEAPLGDRLKTIGDHERFEASESPLRRIKEIDENRCNLNLVCCSSALSWCVVAATKSERMKEAVPARANDPLRLTLLIGSFGPPTPKFP